MVRIESYAFGRAGIGGEVFTDDLQITTCAPRRIRLALRQETESS